MKINSIFSKTFLFIVLAELLSFFGYLYPDFNQLGFLIIVLLTVALSFYKLEYGLWILLTELFIGSKGYLFYFQSGGLILSLRIALWIVVMSMWLGQFLIHSAKAKKLVTEFWQSKYFRYYLALFLFVVFAIVNGVINHNALDNVFFDANGWLYFSIIFPVYTVIFGNKNETTEKVNHLVWIFSAATIWLAIKTLLLLFAFSHNLAIVYDLYHWVRNTGVGEITNMDYGFYRIFIQSHIYNVLGIFIILGLVNNAKIKFNQKLWLALLANSLCLSAVIISLSRSFWIGMVVGVFLLFIYWIIKKVSWQQILKTIGFLATSFVIALGLIIFAVRFPYPSPTSNFSADMLSERAITFSGEAGVSSRWSLLPKLLEQIKSAPILGRGFGATVTYRSEDPRVLESNPTGTYTTYAFEWGVLDIWLKFGFLGLIAYLILIGKISLDILNQQPSVISGAVFGLLAMVIISMFSPYLNHPLGIGYLVLLGVISEHLNQRL